MKILDCIILGGCVLLLQGCGELLYSYGDQQVPQSYSHYYDYNGTYNEPSIYNYQSVDNQYPRYNQYDLYDRKSVSIPKTYHMSQGRPATSHKNRDKTWVRKQNSRGYTILLDKGPKASTVAKTLSHAPKNHRTAQVKHNKNGKPRYSGVYGSYSSKDAAKATYNKLPSQIKSKANIKQWQKVQKDIE